jgi:hypothetical protein
MGKQDFIVKEQAQLSSHPSSPSSGFSSIYPKTDGEWYAKNPDGTVKQVTNAQSISKGFIMAIAVAL